jgi:tRNA1Val (adenine37-N6)-methyltransferase
VPVQSGLNIMPNPYFQFKQFTVFHDQCAMKVTTDACLFGAWCADDVQQLTVDGQRLLDIGAGTGLLSLMMAQKNSGIIDAVEIDIAAAQQAQQNVKDSPFANLITVVNEDILNWKKEAYDVIISNPPFYEKEIPSTQTGKNIAHHSEGLVLESLFKIIQEKLTAVGSFYLLLPYKRKATIDKLLLTNKLHLEKEVIVHSSAAHLPFRLLLKGSKRPSACTSEILNIYDENKQYTPAFTSLLKDYYLYL